MDDLKERLRDIEGYAPPDLWTDIISRESQPLPPGPSPTRRLLVAAFALALAVAGIAFGVRAFSGSGRLSPGASTTPNEHASPTGSNRLIVVLGDPNPGIFSVAADGTGLQQLTSSSHDTDAVPSPDGNKIAFVRHSIYVMNGDGTHLQQLTTDGSDSSPTWSPDGTTIAFSRETPTSAGDTPNADIFTVPVGGGPVVRLTGDPLLEYAPAWSPDGTRIAFGGYEQQAGQPPTPVRLYVMRSDGTGIKLLGGTDVGDPAWSPDGSQIAFAQELGGLFVVRSDGTDLRKLNAPTSAQSFTFSPSWSPDGTQIAFVSGDRITDLQVFIIKADGGGLKQVPVGPSDYLEVSWAPPTIGATTSPVTGRVAGTIDVGRATSVAYGAGSVWVSIDPVNSPNRAILRIDPQSDRVLATIPTPVVPGWEIGGGGLVVAQGSVWVAGPDGSGGAIVRIDPSTNRVTDTITLKGQVVADIAVDASGIWALLRGDPNQPGPEVVRIDPASALVVARIPLSGGVGRYIFAIGGSVIAAIAQPPGGPYDGGTVVRIDPSTNQVGGTFDLGTYPSAAVGDGMMWAVTESGGLVQIDPATSQPTGTPANVPCTGDALAVGAGGVWCFDPARDRALTRFNPRTAQVDVAMRPDQGTGGTALAASPGSIWVVNGEQLTRIDIG
jgi:streptogramin lyase